MKPASLLHPHLFKDYQVRAINHGLTHPRSMHHLFMSAGKTAISLTVFSEHQDALRLRRALVIAPLRVATGVWKQEAAKWSHLQHLRVSVLRGDHTYKLRELHRPEVDIHVINFEAVDWLVDTVNATFLSKGKPLPWQMLIVDEIDRFKNSEGVRFQSFERLLLPPGGEVLRTAVPDPDAPTYFPYRIGLTGTPHENNLADLHGQYRTVDGGKRLHYLVTDFRADFCRQAGYTNTWRVETDENKRRVIARIADITLSLNEDECIKLPDYMMHDHWVELPDKLRAQYNQLEQQLFLEMDAHADDPLDDDWQLVIDHPQSARMKCRQFVNGTVITDDGTSRLVHDVKLAELDGIVHEMNGKPLLLAYMFRHDWKRIEERYKKAGYKVAFIGPGVSDREEQKIYERWVRGDLHLVGAHPASIGHGINALAEGGNEVVWFGLTDQPRLWKQYNARLRRQNQAAESVHVRRILCRDTIDEPMLRASDDKSAEADAHRRMLEEYRAAKQWQ